ncbi:MAG TPA: ABC transporter permease [Patescibacteria group bacterium]|nr:ABC transporter permease [Patescibacteria group bacterium]
MSRVIALIKKEILLMLNSPIAYIVAFVFVMVNNWLYFERFFVDAQANLRSYFSFFPWVFLFVIPAITMRLWAEEKKNGTIEFLLTTALKDWEAVIAKFASALCLVLFILVCTIPVPLTVAVLGNADTGAIIANYIAIFLLAGAMLAIGQWISSLTKNQIIAFLISLLILFALMMMGQPYVLSSTKGLVADIFRTASTATHFESMARGVIDVRDGVYFGSLITLFLFLNIYTLQNRHWK